MLDSSQSYWWQLSSKSGCSPDPKVSSEGLQKESIDLQVHELNDPSK